MGGSGKNFNRANWDPEQASPDNPQNPAPYVPTTTYQPFGSGTLSGTGGTNVYHPDPNSGQPDVASQSPADVERDRQRQIGDDMAQRQAVQLNYGAANVDRNNNLQARETQIQAGDMMRSAATGGQPSRADIEAGQVAGGSLEAQLGASAGQRGPAYGAQGAAAAGATGLQLQGANAGGIGRSAETNRALLSYGQNTGSMRKGDYTQQQLDQRQAEAQAQQQLAQNQRNQTGQMGMERLGLGTEKAAMDLSNREADLNNGAANLTESQRLQESKRGEQTFKDVSNMMPSDARAKKKASLTSLSAKGDALLAQTNANRDSLRYGSSLNHGAPKAEADDIDEGDVNRIRYGHEAYQGDMFKRPIDEESNRDALHAGIERRLQRDADRPAEMAEDEHAQTMREHAAAPRGYDLGTGYSVDPAGDPWKRQSANAPGTDDWLQYGKPRMVTKADGDASQYIAGMAPSHQEEAPMDDYSKAVSLSDEETKKAARLAGEAAASKATQHTESEHLASSDKPKPEGMTGVRANQNAVFRPASSTTVYRGTEAPAGETPDQRTARMLARSKLGTSDERAKNVGLRADKGAGGGEEEHDGTTREHRGTGGGPASAPIAVHADAAMGDHGPLPDRANADGTRSLQQDANRKLEGSTYTYKDGVGEDTAQVHHGQMAQTMEENPITATAVRQGADGLKRVSEFDKLNVTAAGVAELQRQHDEMAAALAKLGARRQRGRIA